MALIDGGDGLFYIGPKLIKIANFSPEFGTVQRNTRGDRPHGQIRVAVAVHYDGICLVLAGNVPLDGVRILDCSQTDEICQFDVKFV